MKFALLIADALDERTELLAVLAHVEASEAQTAGPEGLIDWLRFRVQEIDSMINLGALQISARSAKLDLDEARAAISEPITGMALSSPHRTSSVVDRRRCGGGHLSVSI